MLLRCFTSHGSRTPIPTDKRHAFFKCMGFPIRISPDQSLFASSPKLNAGCRVLHRLILPRHPPYTLVCFNLSSYKGQPAVFPHRPSAKLTLTPFGQAALHLFSSDTQRKEEQKLLAFAKQKSALPTVSMRREPLVLSS
jgi:hypothetical protein